MFKKKRYYYLISYSYNGGVGNSLSILSYKIKTLSDIKKARDGIKEASGFSNICINNFIRMKGE